MLHTEVLPDHSLELLRKLSPAVAEIGFHLAGGTALALQLGHRISIDCDFFSEAVFDPTMTISLLASLVSSPPKVIQQTTGSICVLAEQTKVELFHYPYPVLADPMVEDGISLVSLPDLAAMKLSAIANRGARKDFIDIAALLEEYSLKELLGFHEKKFPQTDLLTVVKSLTWFDEAEAEPDPKFLHQQTWESVKSTILGAVVEEATK